MHEFNLIAKIRAKEKLTDLPAVAGKRVVAGIGDDCAVIDRGKNYELVTTDMLVEDDHFKLAWSTPKQIGIKSAIANLSDIAAIGGVPKYAFISLCLSKNITEKWVLSFYQGLKSVFKNVPILGGDITHGEKVVINIALIGEVEKDRCIRRSGAKINDIICVTGTLGASTAGLEWLKRFGTKKNVAVETRHALSLLTCKGGSRPAPTEIQYCLNKHLEPTCRLKEGRILSKYASGMIDVSDGLGSEVTHLCKESNVGAKVYAEKVPLDPRVENVARFLEMSALDFAMSGGEDFELVFTISEKNLSKLKHDHPNFRLFEVGQITPKKDKIRFIVNGKAQEMPKGFIHF